MNTPGDAPSTSVSHRFLPTTEGDKYELFSACGARTFDDFITGIPPELRFSGDLGVGQGQSEDAMRRTLKGYLAQSSDVQGHRSFLGGGVYRHTCPAAVNQLTLRGEFLTSYTPYQPEMSQGTLQALFEFQSMVAELFGMEVSNASHYDGSTSLAEAALMALRLKKEKKTIVVSEGVHPEYLAVLKTYVNRLGVAVITCPLNRAGVTCPTSLAALLDNHVAGVVVQSPNFYGCIEDQEPLVDLCKKNDACYIANVTEALSLALLQPPGFYGADIATGEGQSFGIPPSFGGPYVGLFTAHLKDVRQMPGRLCGETLDKQGRRAFTLTLSTREQHIRREKATSNICTNQNLLALWATIWLSMMGKQNLKTLAEHNLAKAEYAKAVLLRTDKCVLRYSNTPSFNEFTVDLKKKSAQDFFDACVERGVAPGIVLSCNDKKDASGLLVAVTEMQSKNEIDELAELMRTLA